MKRLRSLFRAYIGSAQHGLLSSASIAARIIDHLPDEQRCTLRHWLHKRTYEAIRRDVRRMGEGEHTILYTLRSFDQHRCIFVHVPKAAGISIATALFGHLAGGHASATYYREVFGTAFWKYFKFTVVRNPYTRLVSAYEFLKRGGHPAFPADRTFRDEVLSQHEDFSAFVLRWVEPRKQWPFPHFRPQCDYLMVGNRVAMDFVGRFERLEKDFRTICHRLDIDSRLQHLNDSGRERRPLGEYLQLDAVIRRVQDTYERDFEVLGYDSKPPC